MIKLKKLFEIEYPIASEKDQQSLHGMDGWKGKVVWMSPDKFLHLAYPLPDYQMNEKSYWNLKKRMKEQLPIDFLSLKIDSKIKKVIGHEGRHRATVAKELGIEKVPVLVYFEESYPRVPKWTEKEHEFLDKLEVSPEWLREIKAYHGGPHDIKGNFKLSKIGTGEGSQAYGWGLYFAGDIKTAEYYKKTISDYKASVDGKIYDIPHWQTLKANPIQYAIKALWSINQTPAMAINGLNSRTIFPDEQAANGAIELIKQDRVKIGKSPGFIYTVEINANDDELLNWDERMSKQGKIGELLIRSFPDIDEFTNGQDAYFRIANYLATKSNSPKNSKKLASKYLLSQGIKGIKYLDLGSRPNKEGTYNYTMFDSKLIKILSKDGSSISPELAANKQLPLTIV